MICKECKKKVNALSMITFCCNECSKKPKIKRKLKQEMKIFNEVFKK